MANAGIDQNRVKTLLAGLESDGVTIVPLMVNPTTHGLMVDDGSTGTDYGPESAPRDENRGTAVMAVSETDGTTPVVAYATAGGSLLVDSN